MTTAMQASLSGPSSLISISKDIEPLMAKKVILSQVNSKVITVANNILLFKAKASIAFSQEGINQLKVSTKLKKELISLAKAILKLNIFADLLETREDDLKVLRDSAEKFMCETQNMIGVIETIGDDFAMTEAMFNSFIDGMRIELLGSHDEKDDRVGFVETTLKIETIVDNQLTSLKKAYTAALSKE